MTKQQVNTVVESTSTDSVKQNLENRVATAATRYSTDTTAKVAAEKATVLPGLLQDDETPNLPGSSLLNN
jgi:hypothetical protein